MGQNVVTQLHPATRDAGKCSILVKGIANVDNIRVLFQGSWRECVLNDRLIVPAIMTEEVCSVLDYS